MLIWILLVFHPRHKLEYFKKHNWEELWIQAAHNIVHDEFNRSHATVEIHTNNEDMQMGNMVSHIAVGYTYFVCLLC
jgi:cobalamin biosynthesis Co2+ chelatase CbiK